MSCRWEGGTRKCRRVCGGAIFRFATRKKHTDFQFCCEMEQQLMHYEGERDDGMPAVEWARVGSSGLESAL